LHWGRPTRTSHSDGKGFPIIGRFFLGVVGFSQRSTSQSAQATIWDEEGRPFSIASILTHEGIDLGDWRLTSATTTAADGRTVAGFGFNPGLS
jgi:hypothetical protein